MLTPAMSLPDAWSVDSYCPAAPVAFAPYVRTPFAMAVICSATEAAAASQAAAACRAGAAEAAAPSGTSAWTAASLSPTAVNDAPAMRSSSVLTFNDPVTG